MHSIPLVALGTGLLWFGWYGFNAGQRAAGGYDHRAGLPQHRRGRLLCRRRLAGHRVELVEKKPKFVGLLTGAVAGLATITPAAGYVTTGQRRHHRHHRRAGLLLRRGAEEPAALGRRAGRLGRARRGRHSWASCCSASSPPRPSTRRASTGCCGGTRLLLQASRWRLSAAGVYAFVFTYAMLWLINKITPVRITEAEEAGLDEALHGEQAYEM